MKKASVLPMPWTFRLRRFGTKFSAESLLVGHLTPMEAHQE